MPNVMPYPETTKPVVLVRRLAASHRNADVLAIETNVLKQRLATSRVAECNACNDGIRGGCSACSYNIK